MADKGDEAKYKPTAWAEAYDRANKNGQECVELREALEAAYEYFGLENQVDPTAGYEYELAEQIRTALSKRRT